MTLEEVKDLINPNSLYELMCARELDLTTKARKWVEKHLKQLGWEA